MWMELILAMVGAALFALLLGVILRWRAPARKNTQAKAWIGYFLPTVLVVWSAGVLITPPGPTHWAAIWLPFGVLTLIVSILLATIASPKEPSKREERSVDRKGEPLDPLFLLYSFGMTIALVTAVVTRGIWA